MNKYIEEAQEYAQNTIHHHYKEKSYDKEEVEAVCHALHILEAVQTILQKTPQPK